MDEDYVTSISIPFSVKKIKKFSRYMCHLHVPFPVMSNLSFALSALLVSQNVYLKIDRQYISLWVQKKRL